MRIFGKSHSDGNKYIVELSQKEMNILRQKGCKACEDCPSPIIAVSHVKDVTKKRKIKESDEILDQYNKGEIDIREMKRRLKNLT